MHLEMTHTLKTEIKHSCLVLTDDDFLLGTKSIDDIVISNIRTSLDDFKLARVVIYYGKHGQKILKMTLRTIKRVDFHKFK